jgi:hypothetical protein
MKLLRDFETLRCAVFAVLFLQPVGSLRAALDGVN